MGYWVITNLSAGGGRAGESLYAGQEKDPQYAGNSVKAGWDTANKTGIIGQVCATGSRGPAAAFRPVVCPPGMAQKSEC
jgi:hypothetical protein